MTGFVPRPVPAGLAEQLAEHKVPFVSLEDACKNCSHLDGDDVDYPKVSSPRPCWRSHPGRPLTVPRG